MVPPQSTYGESLNSARKPRDTTASLPDSKVELHAGFRYRKQEAKQGMADSPTGDCLTPIPAELLLLSDAVLAALWLAVGDAKTALPAVQAAASACLPVVEEVQTSLAHP